VGASDLCETPEGAAHELADVDGILVPGGFGVRGIEGKLGALRFARENKIPTLGICLGLQCMVIEYARDVVGLTGASSSEFDPDTEFPVIATMAEQVDLLQQIADAGLVFSGISPDRSLVEYIELPVDVHPFYVATQAHPELRSRPNRPHPLFRGLIGAALERQQASRLFEVADPGEPPVDVVAAEPVAQPAQA
jgi:CTP synthase